MKAELYSFLLENKFKNGVMYIKSMHEFVVRYDMAESVEEESLMRGFLMNEKIEIFVWLFEIFLEVMGNVQPKTMMTDQAFSTANAIERVSPLAKHRLCT